MREKLQSFSRQIVFAQKMVLYSLIFAAFFVLLSIPNPQILRLSRTAGITMSTFAILLMVLSSIYGGYAIGRKKSKSIIYSMTMAVWLSDFVAYFQLQIMNVNDANNEYLQLGGLDLGLLCLAMAIQLGLIIVFSYFGNFVFFKINPPENCVIITSSDAYGACAAEKIGKYRLQYRVSNIVHYQSSDLYVEILKCNTVFIYEVPLDVRREIVEFCYKNYRNVYYQMGIMDVIEASAEQVFLDDASFLSYTKPEQTIEQRFFKRLVDIVVSCAAIVLFSPLMLACALLILICDGRPIIFKQSRLTRGGRRFKIYKFRTMLTEDLKDNPQVSVQENDVRVTKLGFMLRRLRLDELPQFFNILKGEMSLVGPRPEMLENVDLYTRELPEFSYRLKVKAGLTGYAQIVGRYNTLPKDKLVMDLMYIENYSLWHDVKLLFKTPTALLKPDSTQGFRQPTAGNAVYKKQPERSKPYEIL